MLKWTASGVLAKKKQNKRRSLCSYGQQDEIKVKPAASNMNHSAFTCKDAIILVMSAILLVQALVILILFRKIM